MNVSLSSINVENSSSFRWETGVVFSLNRNRILRLTGLDANGDGKEDDDRGNSWFIGKSLGALYDYTIDGVLQSADSVWGKSFGFQPGDLIIRDISGPDGTPDGKITADDRSIVGYSVPNFTMNITNTLSYKNLQLYFDINFIAGGGKNNYYLGSNLTGLNPAQLAPEVATWLNLPYWTPARQNDLYPRPNYGNPYGYRFYQSRSFARLQNLSLSYSIPAALSKKWHFQNARVFVSGRNLFTKTKWIGLDPETGGTIGGSNPALRAFTIGFSTSF